MEKSIHISPEAKLDAAVNLLEQSEHKLVIDPDELQLFEECEIELLSEDFEQPKDDVLCDNSES